MGDVSGIQTGVELGHNAVLEPFQGIYRGQRIAVVNDPSPSIILQASQSASIEASRKKQASLLERKFETKASFQNKEKILNSYLFRLSQPEKAQQYRECLASIDRLKYKTEYHDEAGKAKLKELLIYKTVETFGEVTEQDNFWEYALAINDIEQSNLETSVAQTKKMLDSLENPQQNSINIAFANSEKARWSEKLKYLTQGMEGNSILRKEILHARENLQKTHKQEIRDGYNLIPKAAALLQSQNKGNGENNSVRLASTYRDEILCMTSPMDVFETFIKRQEAKREQFRPYIDSMISLLGIDMASSNPSRSKEELWAVREGLFRVEICGQIYDQIGTLMDQLKEM